MSDLPLDKLLVKLLMIRIHASIYNLHIITQTQKFRTVETISYKVYKLFCKQVTSLPIFSSLPKVLP